MGFDFSYVWGALPILVLAAKVNLFIALGAFAASLVLGTLIALARHAEIPVLRQVLAVYISFIRGTPGLIQIFIVYYVFPRFGLDLAPLAAGILALAMNSSAFTAEIVRAGISSVPLGNFEASAALGLNAFQRWWLVILPQVFRVMLPALMNEFTIVLKGTPIVSLITVVEILRTAQRLISQNYRPFEMLVAAAIVFFVLNFIVGRFVAVIERRAALQAA